MTQPNHTGMDVANTTVLITGANRGIGRALVDEALRRGAKRVFAGSRGSLGITDGRVTLLTLDVTDASQIHRAVEAVDSLDILINNAGVAIYDDLSNPDVVERHLQVNFLGMLRMTCAFAPRLKRSRDPRPSASSAVRAPGCRADAGRYRTGTVRPARLRQGIGRGHDRRVLSCLARRGTRKSVVRTPAAPAAE